MMQQPEDQVRKVMQRSLWMMGMGTFAVLLFSDPMVAVMTEIGDRTGISGFYISFVLAPMASNASELIAAYRYGYYMLSMQGCGPVTVSADV
jgi:Ca2+/Na+ antiporter